MHDMGAIRYSLGLSMHMVVQSRLAIFFVKGIMNAGIVSHTMQSR